MFAAGIGKPFPIIPDMEKTMTNRKFSGRKGARLYVALLITAATSFQLLAAPKFSDWSAPVNLGLVVNSESEDFAPHISKNGLSLYFASDRPGSIGNEDLWVSRRDSENSPWGLPMNLGATINSMANDRSPALSRDGHYLFFATNREGSNGLDIWVSWRTHTDDDFSWQPPVSLGALVNSAATDAGPSFFENDSTGIPQLFMASNRAGGLDLYVSSLIGGVFQTPVSINELNTGRNDLTPTIRHDGLEIIFASNRTGSAGSDLWAATRETVFAPWSEPVRLNMQVNSGASETFPVLSSDGTELYFSSARTDGMGGSDLYVTRRSKLTSN
jgi:Tol biopolymer transport system component